MLVQTLIRPNQIDLLTWMLNRYEGLRHAQWSLLHGLSARSRSLAARTSTSVVETASGVDADDETQPASAVSAASAAAQQKLIGRILVVEDEGIVALDIKMTLRRLGHDVIDTVDSGKAAVKVALERTPDLILMDIRLKDEVDGIEAARMIKRFRDIPVIYLTGQLDESTVRRAQTTDPAGYLGKPFTAPDLAALIQKALQRTQGGP